MTESAFSEAGPAPSRGGRNLPVAIAVGVGLLAVVGGSLYFRKEVFIGFAILAIGAALWELSRALGRRDVRIPLLPLWVGTAGMLISTYTAGAEALMVSFILTVAGLVVWRVVDGGGIAAVRDAAAGVFAAAYLPLMAGFVMLMLAADNGREQVLLFILLAVANDVGGFFAGVRFGKHPLAPSVSPKKSWEGLAGSFVLALAVGLVGAVLVLKINPVIGLTLGFLAPLTATLGDLAESMIKRDLELKDMGSLLPGHGGVLDRLDSMLLTAPFVYLLFSVAPSVAT
ncbi:phosphatidate cytidylyltransferase [Sanguibacter gelidistatuariae]|uniref:Phosphatidate cytidylyltransferase n=1 Tax=Sanguibacter gelidistatuariae TaxID=1814289 RepID=A0A1G6NLH5_9MICO|nr:phosphatidate cytidylyltransferase [Sanguibacter gelidistatuariae]SDC68511.1 phosphatidate cytidylyltransferase [Sanguibacter gelidistatuariae]